MMSLTVVFHLPGVSKLIKLFHNLSENLVTRAKIVLIHGVLFKVAELNYINRMAALEVLPEFEAVLGSTANLPCQVPQRPPESGFKCIFWYKDDEVMSVYTVDAREGGQNTLHVPSDRLRSRAFFDPNPWPPVLKMVSIKEGDAGVYYCRVDYRWDRTYMYTIVLKVIVPPQKLVILNDHDEEIIGMAGPYLEGQSVKLTCEAIGGL
ncbi:uncharacterized protein CDAR_291861 [Caerostris darwini]|uniref:Ig-like domain-containing protein n=1 Tax=Caerostris darwini TaxID=1538125 RepID=A0AAV4NW91_9ARAC|nr:uncharacterized protein CDAR_291861 [Caerostris darwini]